MDSATEPQAPEVLKPRADDGTPQPEAEGSSANPDKPKDNKPLRRRSYRPSHKATFIGLGVVILILAINAGVLGFVLKNKSKSDDLASKGQVTISKAALNQVGVNSSTLGNSGVVLTVDPNAQFNGTLGVAGDVTLSGQLKLNSKFTASDASLTQLEAGNTSLAQLNVSGDSTLSALNLRNGLVVAGATQLQGAVTVNQLLTVNNSLTVTGNLAIGGTFSARNLNSTSSLTIGGHLVSSGLAPAVGPGGPALGSNGTVGISGNDSAGVVSINIGTGSAAGTLANVAFRTQYASTPRVVITPVGVAANFYVTNLSVAGFSIGVGSGLPTGGFGVDYIVEQ